MRIGTTVEGFDIHTGDTLYVSMLVDIPQPINIIPAPTAEDPDAIIEIKVPPKKVFQPIRVIADESLKEKAWRRHRDCWIYCETLNREPKS